MAKKEVKGLKKRKRKKKSSREAGDTAARAAGFTAYLPRVPEEELSAKPNRKMPRLLIEEGEGSSARLVQKMPPTGIKDAIAEVGRRGRRKK